MNSTCFDCGATLNPKSQAIWTCTNAGCPGGTEKHLCGYCNASSFSPITGICANQTCRTHKIARSTCPACQYQSVLTVGGMTFCLNRLCPTHAGWVAACPTCNNNSLVQLDGTAVCVKSTCANLLYLVPWPASIGSRRGLGGNPPSAGPGAGRAAPATTALRRPTGAGMSGPGAGPRYLADPDASTVMPGGQHVGQDQATTVIRPAGPRYAVDADAGTVMPGASAPPAAPNGIDKNASQPPMTMADSVAATVLNAPPKKPMVMPAGFDENAETVLQPPPKV